jgi:benzodiazapine receptor
MPRGRARDVVGLAVSIAVCFGSAAVGSLLTQPSLGEWYAQLRKPAWTPPNWVFGPVWSALYLSMAVAAWLIWRNAGTAGARFALTLFGIQLGLNVAWSGVFFGLRLPGIACLEIAVLWLAIAATTAVFWGRNRTAAMLMVPYLAWVTFAGVLNAAIWSLNA